MSFPLRAIILTLCLAPYIYFGLRDVWHHKQHRKVSYTERLLHLTMGMTLTIIVPHAYMGHLSAVIPGMVLFIAARTLDEFVFHRGLPGAEIDLHAKTHFSFLVFVVGVMATSSLSGSQL